MVCVKVETMGELVVKAVGWQTSIPICKVLAGPVSHKPQLVPSTTRGGILMLGKNQERM